MPVQQCLEQTVGMRLVCSAHAGERQNNTQQKNACEQRHCLFSTPEKKDMLMKQAQRPIRQHQEPFTKKQDNCQALSKRFIARINNLAECSNRTHKTNYFWAALIFFPFVLAQAL
jgi:hypothetical protein